MKFPVEPIIIIGPPGTGKTTTLLDYVEIELTENGIAPDRIGFFAFTKRAAVEVIERAVARFQIDAKEFRFFSTLHSCAYKQLGMHRGTIFTGSKLHDFGNEYGYQFKGHMTEEGVFIPHDTPYDMTIAIENLARTTRTSWEERRGQFDIYYEKFPIDADMMVQNLRAYKEKHRYYDFTDMLDMFVSTNDPPVLDVLIIDESQDLSLLQWEMVEVLARHVKRIYIAGDDDQTIFTWAGASTAFIYIEGREIFLPQSYRVPECIHALANRIVRRIHNRREKQWHPRPATGSFHPLYCLDELSGRYLTPEYGSVMMLARTNGMLLRYVQFCRERGLLYQKHGTPSVSPTLRRVITTWKDLMEGHSVSAADAVQLYSMLPSTGHVDKKGLVQRGYKKHLERYALRPNPAPLGRGQLVREYGLLAVGPWQEALTEIDEDERTYLDKVERNGFDLNDKPYIQISTIHRVKGGQANTVVLLSDTPRPIEEGPAVGFSDEEIRIFYTAVTRTYETLFVVHPRRAGPGRYFEPLFM